MKIFKQTAGSQFDAGILEAHVEQGAMEIRAMNQRVRISEPLANAALDGYASYLFRRDPVHTDERLGIDRHTVDRMTKTQRFEHPEPIRPDLDPSSYLGELVGLLDDDRVAPGDRESAGCGEAGNAATHNQEWKTIVHAGTTLMFIEPTPEIDASIISPGAIGPTPSGVPLKRTSPGWSV